MRGVWIGAATAAVLVIWWRRRRKQLSTQSEAWESHLCRLPAQLSLEEKAQLRAHISTSERGDYYSAIGTVVMLQKERACILL